MPTPLPPDQDLKRHIQSASRPGDERESDPGKRKSSGSWFSRTFSRFSKSASHYTGHPISFCLAVGAVVIWLISGPFFQYSNTWQLVINTGTTIITFLMVFLIQNTQNRDMAATHIKLDELIRSQKGAHNALLDLEELEEDELEKMRARYEDLAARSRAILARGDGEKDQGCEEISDN